MWIVSWLLGCAGDGCPKTDLATYPCPDGTCVADLAQCYDVAGECAAGWSLCEATGECVDVGVPCEDTGGT